MGSLLTSTVEREAPPTWAIEQVLLPALKGAVRANEIEVRRGESAEDVVAGLQPLFAAALRLLRDQTPINFESLAREIRSSEQRVKTLLGKVEDWNWLIDEVRLSESDRGFLPITGSSVLIKSDPCPRSGASIFGVASRSIPNKVMKGLADAGVAPPHNSAANGTATDCSAWALEIAPRFSIGLRIEPLPERTFFNPASYNPEQRHIADHILRNTHGFYEVSTQEIVNTDLLGSFLASVKRLRGSTRGLTFESGCLAEGLQGRHEQFIGSRLEPIVAIERGGGRAFFDLARVQANDPNARRHPGREPWSGLLRMGEEDCRFWVEGRPDPLPSWKMAWAAQITLGIAKSLPELEGIFRPASDRAIAQAGTNPRNSSFAVAWAYVGKIDSPPHERTPVSFLVGSRGGMVPSGFSIPFADIRHLDVQAEVIAMAENHYARVAPNGKFTETLSYLRNVGAQGAQTRLRSQIRSLHGVILITDILDTRSRLYN